MKEALLILILMLGGFTLNSLKTISKKVTPAPCYTRLPEETKILKFIPDKGDRCYAGIIKNDTIQKFYSIACSDTSLILGLNEKN